MTSLNDMVLLVAAVAIGYVRIQTIHAFDSISVWLATVSGGLSVCVSTQCRNLHNIQSKYGQVAKALVDTRLWS